MKLCTKCGIEKDESEFSFQGPKYRRLCQHCKKCRRVQQKKWRTANLKKNKEIVGRYNLSIEEYNNLIEEQENRCIICQRTFTQDDKICVDHDHIAGAIRGLLCYKCNTGLGNFGDNPLLLLNAIRYLEAGKI